MNGGGKINKLSQWWCRTGLGVQEKKKKKKEREKNSKQKQNEIFYSAPHWLEIWFKIHRKHSQHHLLSLMVIVWFQLFQSKLMSGLTTVAVILKHLPNTFFLISPTFQVCIDSLYCLVIHYTHTYCLTQQLTFLMPHFFLTPLYSQWSYWN